MAQNSILVYSLKLGIKIAIISSKISFKKPSWNRCLYLMGSSFLVVYFSRSRRSYLFPYFIYFGDRFYYLYKTQLTKWNLSNFYPAILVPKQLMQN